MALLQRLELLERQRVDRPHEPQLALELADAAGGVMPSGSRGHSAAIAASGSQSSSRRTSRRRSRGAAASRPRRARPRRARSRTSSSVRSALGPLPAQPVEPRGDGAGRLGLAAAALVQLGELALDDGRGGRRRRSPRRSTATGRWLELDPALRLRPRALGDVARQAAPRPRSRRRCRNVRRSSSAGGAHLEVGAQGADGGGPLLEPLPGLGHRPPALGGAGLLGLERRAARPRARRRGRARARHAVGQLGEVGAQRRRARSRRRAGRRRRAPRPSAGGGEPAVVLVERPRQLGVAATGRRRARRGAAATRGLGAGGGGSTPRPPLAAASSSAAPVAPARGPPTRQPASRSGRRRG